MTATGLRPRRPALALAGAVLALHVLALLMLASLGTWRDRGPADSSAPPLTVWLLDDKPARSAVPSTPAPATPRPPAAALPRPPRPAEPAAITLPALPAAPEAAAPPPAPRAVEPAAPASAPLNLALPRSASAPWRQRNPALDDPRANTRGPVNMATLIDRALGGDPNGPITEEALSDGSRRFRRGRGCVVVHPSQAQVIDAFNSSFAPKPGVVDAC